MIEDLAIRRARRGNRRRPREASNAASGIQVQLVNPKSWLSGGEVSLDLEILRRADRRPEEGVRVEAAIEGAEPGLRRTRAAATGSGKRAHRISFAGARQGRSDACDSGHNGFEPGRNSLRDARRSPKRPRRVPRR